MRPLKVAWQWSLLFWTGLVIDILGLFVVAIAIPFRVDDYSKSDGRRIVNLPRWAWLWGNDYDGLTGDKDNKYAALTPFGVAPDSYLGMWWWAAIRNPSNNTRFVKFWQSPAEGVITYSGDYKVGDHGGQAGSQFVTLTANGKEYYGYYLVREWSPTRAFIIRLGFKIEPDDMESPRETKGYVMKINPYKETA